MNADHRNNGRFAPGNPGGPGRPRGCAPAEYLRRELLNNTTPDQVKAVMSKLYGLALDGDVSAARCFLDHTVGRPLQAVELAPSDRDFDTSIFMQVVVEVLNTLPNGPDVTWQMAAVFRLLRQGRTRDVREAIRIAMQEPDRHASRPSAVPQGRVEVPEVPRNEAVGFAVAGPSLDAIADF